MSKSLMLLWLSLLGRCLVPSLATAQGHDSANAKVTNVRFESLGDQISISYDLQGQPDDEHEVTADLRRESDPSFRHHLVRISGDAGRGVFSGMYKKILWDLKVEFPEGLVGDDYYFVVSASPVSSESSALLWVGAAVAIGGATAYFLLRNNAEASSPVAIPSGFPAPPGRP